MHARVLHAAAADLGEGPVWDHPNDQLVWVNITAGQVLATALDGTTTVLFTGPEAFGPSIGFVAPWQAGWIIGQFQTLLFTTDWKDVSVIGAVPDLGPTMRINDGKLGPDNCLVFGTLCNEDTPEAAALYSLDLAQIGPDQLQSTWTDGDAIPALDLTTVATDIGISNGLAWNAAADRMFYIDTVTSRIDAFDWSDGGASNRRPFVEFPASYGYPDGMTIDDQDRLWIAFWSGNAIRSVTASGEISEPIPIEAHNPTSVAVGEAGRLFVTSARQESPENPADGAVFIIEP